MGRHRQGLKEACRVEMFRLVPLADSAAAYKVTDKAVEAAVVEGSSQPVKSLLGTLMTGLMSITEQLWPQAGALRDEDMVVVEQQAVNKLPPCRRRARSKLTVHLLSRYILM